MKYIAYSLLGLVFLAFLGCEPYIEEKTELQPIPTPSFEILTTEDTTPNDFLLKNTTPGAFITQWDLGDLGKMTGQEVVATFPFKGEYEIKMTTFTQGGSDSTSQMHTVEQDDPRGCKGNLELLTGCSEKIWKLAPEPNAMIVGPDLNQVWWGNSYPDVSTRECKWNDRYIFRSNGEYEFDNKGDFWADVDGDGNVFPPELMVPEGCHSSDVFPPSLQAWDAGLHSFNVTETELSLIGLGAFMGLYKVGTTGEVGAPQPSTTFTILELTENRLTVAAVYDWGAWRMTFVPE